jgi:hypothetical protein
MSDERVSDKYYIHQPHRIVAIKTAVRDDYEYTDEGKSIVIGKIYEMIIYFKSKVEMGNMSIKFDNEEEMLDHYSKLENYLRKLSNNNPRAS